MADEEVLYGIGTVADIRKKMTGKPVARSHNMGSEMLTELMDAIQTGIESYITVPNMPELATKAIKEVLDKKFGPAWQCIIGEGFAYDISVQSDAYLLMFYNGNLGCLVFKTWSMFHSYILYFVIVIDFIWDWRLNLNFSKLQN